MRFREPLFIPLIALCCGITFALFQRTNVGSVIAASTTLIVIAGIARVYAPRVLPLVAATLSLVFGGIALVELHQPKVVPLLSVPDNTMALFSGCVTEPALIASDRERFVVDLATNARARVSLFASADQTYPDLPYGSKIEFEGKVRRSHNYNDPGTFDSVHFLARQKIFWTASGNAARLRVLRGKCGNPVAKAIFTIRAGALARLDELYAGDAYADGMMQAILLGETGKLDRMWTEDYRSTGTFHALVISGSHVAVLAFVFLFLLRICGVPATPALLFTILMAWLYTGITGWQAPVLRSAAGMTAYAIARIFYRDGRLLNILAGVAFIFALIDPEQIFDASFQLSFLAVAIIGAFVVPALAATSTPLARGLSHFSNLPKDVRLSPKTAQFRVELRLLAETLELAFFLPRRAARLAVLCCARAALYLYEIFVTSFFIQVGLALPMIVYFHRLSASGLSANAVVVPVLSAIVPLGFLAIATRSHILAQLCAWLLSVSRSAAGFHARREPQWRIPSPPWWLAALLVIFLIAAALRSPAVRWRTAAWAAAAVALIVIVLHPFHAVTERGKFELSVLDVGQGDSLLTAFPDGTLMLIDAGGIPSFGKTRKPGIDIGEDVVSPYLWSRSIKHLNVVAMTHAHEDHMGGMNAVLKNFHPDELWTGAVQESPEWQRVRSTASLLHIRIRQQLRGEPFAFGGASVQVLAPGPDYTADSTPKNDDSLVMRIRFGATSFLLTGDMEKKVERELVSEHLLGHDDVLKVGHHGSRTSSTGDLLDAVRPEFAIISAGFDNTYGHPHPLTLEALRERRIAVFRTDEQGLVRIVSDGRCFRVETGTGASVVTNARH